MDVEQRAREMNLAMTVEEVARIISGAPFPSKQSLSKARAVVEFMENRSALTPPEGHVVVTRNEAGQAVSVTRQDDEGRTLSVIAEFEPVKGDMGNPISVPDGFVLVPVEPTEAMQIAVEKANSWLIRYEAPEIWAAMLAARPEEI